MTVNFRCRAAVVAWCLMISAGTTAKTIANDGLKPIRYLGTLDRSASSNHGLRTGHARGINPLRPTELIGTIEGIEKRKPETVVSWSNPVTLMPICAKDAHGLLQRAPSGPNSMLTLTAETRTSTENYGRIVLIQPSTTQVVVKHFVEFPAWIQMIESASFEKSPVESLEDGWFNDFDGVGQDGCDFFGECNKCFLGTRDLAEPEDLKNGKQCNEFSLQRHLDLVYDVVARLIDYRNPGPLISPLETKLTISTSHSSKGSLTRSLFSVVEASTRAVRHFVGPFLNYAQVFDLLKGIPSIPQWIFSTIWPDNMGQNVSPFGILY